MSFAGGNSVSTAYALPVEKWGISRQPQVSMTLQDVLNLPENTPEELDLKLALLQEKLDDLQQQEVRPLTKDELEMLRRESRECLMMD